MIGPVLIVEDDKLQREMLAGLLQQKLGFESTLVGNGHEALKVLDRDLGNINLVIMDLNMPVMGGMETLAIIRERHQSLPVIMLTGSKDTEDVVAAMKLGATDFITKPFQKERILVTVENALKIGSLTNEVKRLSDEKQGALKFYHLIGHDGGLAHVISTGRKASMSDIPVLITGDTGTGKEIFARAIHGEGLRTGKAFVAVNCGAIPSQLVESTLFGHEKGAFTGAIENAPGKFREAEGGTIFLDEIGELPLDAQVKLLRVLQQKEVEPVGAARSVPINVRVISATNRDLEKLVSERKFREDLFFRLNVLHIEIPPLAQRRQDIPFLARHFIERFCAREARALRDITPEGLERLLSFNWPGNVRELENMINRELVLNGDGALDFKGLGGARMHPSINKIEPDLNLRLFNDAGEIRTIEEMETQVIQAALDHFNHNITQAARALGISKSTLYRKLSEREKS